MSRALNKRGNHVVDVASESLCTGCRNCARVCPDVAIAIERLAPASSHAAATPDKE
jgi:Fe-S-cluster-containing hydrogenase component 2